MTKESIYELQRIDCNCNDCGFMKRDFNRFKQSLEDHHQWQLDHFNAIKNRIIKKAKEWEKKGETEKQITLLKQAESMKFQFNKAECLLNFGNCDRFMKPITFISGICQLDTQKCFIHRKDYAL